MGLIGLALLVHGYTRLRRLRRYECENATDCGRVRFDGVEDALEHEEATERAAGLMTVGSLFMMGAVFVVTLSASAEGGPF